MPSMASWIGPEGSAELDGAHSGDGAVPEWIKRPGGRPSLSAPGTTSPQVSFRLPAKVRDQAARIARRQDKTLSRFAREALETHVEAWLLEEAARIAALRAKLQRRGPGILDLPAEAFVEDVDDG